ncbi:iron complex transport system ATP-binding protein [Ruminococcus sp. YE71]|uniref:ABC transporter ATP-binding protein n=1 Tax=unclassified Ruminococcus TaxID=2608920 RepID=UPI00088D0C70|nr:MULTISPECIES: ABC transporter ATP-binding protein [unclassified Ruminococcus]SDA15534.1 iron complex transport system ATP-binding protein [Ruminococcus sp. YE78]SFW22731.1 iron complex transport system ATP-binding protein [Ruminococcus sp. YE71]
MELLSAKGLSAGYGKTVIVEGLSFELREGEVLTVIGRNGSGKSTLLKTVTGQLSIISGEVYIGERGLGSMTAAETARIMSLMLTDRITAERMTCRAIVESGRYPYTGRLGLLSKSDSEVVEDAMRLTDVTDLADRDFRFISDGQRQRVMLARAIAQQPKIMLLDEPTSYLDIGAKLRLLTLLRQLVRERGIAVMMTLHELELAQRFSDRVLCLADKPLLGTPEEIFSGGRIAELYGVPEGSFCELYGSAEPQRIGGEPQVFVIGGGGTGVSVYRRLWREGVPFAAGVLHENDAELPVAKALAAEVVTERAFEPISDSAYAKASALLAKCPRAVCTLTTFGTTNAANARLLEQASALGKLEN